MYSLTNFPYVHIHVTTSQIIWRGFLASQKFSMPFPGQDMPQDIYLWKELYYKCFKHKLWRRATCTPLHAILILITQIVKILHTIFIYSLSLYSWVLTIFSTPPISHHSILIYISKNVDIFLHSHNFIVLYVNDVGSFNTQYMLQFP